MTGVIVVGVDGSETSRRALRWAVDEARLRNAAVRAVHAWQYPVESAWAGAPVDLYDRLEQAAEEKLESIVMEEAEEDTDAIERVLVSGSPAASLVEASAGAELLVVGSRGLGGFKGLLLGSVGQQCVHHAGCPVVVIPHVEDLGS